MWHSTIHIRYQSLILLHKLVVLFIIFFELMFEQTVREIILTLIFIADKFLLKILGSVVCLLIKYY